MIGRYTKKPINIEAIQYAGDDNQAEIVKWANGNIYPVNVGYGTSLHCKTLEGELIISVGDWIIKGVKGEFYPCRDDIFKLTYQCQHIHTEPATDPDFDFKCQDCGGKFINAKPENEVEQEIRHRIAEGKLIPAERLEDLPRIIHKAREKWINQDCSYEINIDKYIAQAILNHIKGEKKGEDNLKILCQ